MIGIVIMLVQLLFAAFRFFGIYWFFICLSPVFLWEGIGKAVAAKYGNFFGMLPNSRGNILAPTWLYDLTWYLALFMMAATTIRNIIRIFVPDFSYLELLGRSSQARQQRLSLFPKVSKELTAPLPQGFIFGRKRRSFVRKPSDMDGHILVIGGAGSGKTSCVAIPSLMAWEHRVFAIDIKGELEVKTGRRRPNIKTFNPMSSISPGYDPYYLLKMSDNPVQDAREIALSIIPLPQEIKEPFFIEAAQNLFTGAILHFFSVGYTFTATIEAVQGTPIEQLVTQISESGMSEARYFVNQFVGMNMKTLSGVYAELGNKIMVFATDPHIKRCLSKPQSITPADLERGQDVYIQIPEDKLEQWKGLLTLIVNQFLKHFERRPDENATPVLFLLDEYARLGKVETVVNGLATLRSKKITICIVTQSLAQLDVIYGKSQRQVIADNCQYKAILSATDAETQDYFSRLVGTYDRAKTSKSANYAHYTGIGKGTGTSTTTEEKRIIKPEDFAILEDIVLLSPFGFMRINKAPYYMTKEFL